MELPVAVRPLTAVVLDVTVCAWLVISSDELLVEAAVAVVVESPRTLLPVSVTVWLEVVPLVTVSNWLWLLETCVCVDRLVLVVVPL